MLRRRKDKPVADGRIVTVSSMSGITPESPTGPAYSAAKAAVLHLTRVTALEAAPMGITANIVAPGLIDTPAARGDLTAAQIEAARQAIPIGRLGKPEDIAETIAFLASPRRRLHYRRRHRGEWRPSTAVRSFFADSRVVGRARLSVIARYCAAAGAAAAPGLFVAAALAALRGFFFGASAAGFSPAVFASAFSSAGFAAVVFPSAFFLWWGAAVSIALRLASSAAVRVGPV